MLQLWIVVYSIPILLRLTVKVRMTQKSSFYYPQQILTIWINTFWILELNNIVWGTNCSSRFWHAPTIFVQHYYVQLWSLFSWHDIVPRHTSTSNRLDLFQELGIDSSKTPRHYIILLTRAIIQLPITKNGLKNQLH